VRQPEGLSFTRYRDASESLVTAVQRAAADADDVDAVYLLQAESPSGPHLALGVVLAAGADASVPLALGRIVAAALPAGATLDILPLAPDQLTPSAEPVYQRAS
jgi:hypothetical protein